MTFTDYRTAARMRDVIAEVAGDVIKRKNLGYRYATVDNIDEVKNRANVLFGGEVTPVPIRMGAMKPTAGALVRVRGKHGDLHIEGIVDGKIGDFSAEHFTVDHITVAAGITGGSRIDLEDTQGSIWFRGTGGPMGIKWRGDLTGDNHELQLVYRTSPNTLGVEDASSSAIMEWDTDNKETRVYGSVVIDRSPAQIWFIDPTDVSNFIIHINSDKFFLLPDRNGDGSWETPYPFVVDLTTTPNEVQFWVGAGGFTSFIRDDGLFRVNEIHANHGTETRPTYSFVNNGDTGLYLNSGIPTTTHGGSRVLHMQSTQVVGIGDNTKNLGNSSNRWKSVWAADGTINTSDAGQKEDIVDSDLGLSFIRALRPRRNRRVGGTRPHYSLIAQEVKQTLDAMGQDFAGYIDPAVTFMEDEYTEGIFEEPGTLGLRYHEFIAPMIAAIQELANRVETLEGSPSGPSQ